eukprot:TRINITY_DN10914_c0_g1_i1.p1 TRINITY_DN10914_c0_g1~~TRINITY_DN10914_c0_g1_i1.p1  ORF type:complete len:614 (+),score=87.86 TRINITY_DN10914_c0_g1_i1:92-1933(+)
MTSFLDFERANNTLLAALNKPEFAEIVNLAIKYKGTIFIPQLVSIAQIEITPQFVGAHIYVTNPANRNEFVTLNGCIGVFTMRNDLKVLNVIDTVRPFTIADLTGNIFSRRQLFEVTEYKQSIQVLRNAEIQVGKQLMIINLIASPIGAWKQSAQQVDVFAMANHKIVSNASNSLQKSKSLPKIPATTSKADMKNPKDQFFAKMKDPSAAKIANFIKRFLGGFLQSPPQVEEQSNAVQQFREKVLNAMAVHPLWKNLPPAEFDATAETLEKYVMTKLYSCCFAPSIEEIQKDKEFAKRLSRLQFLTPANFDIDPIHQNESKYQMAMNELRKMNAYKAPRDKLICILNCSKVIFSILNRGRSVLDSETGSADHFLPILIYITLKANPPSIHSNLQYILRFRDPQKLASETAYYYAQVELAVMFLSELDATRVTIDPQEFERQFNKGVVDNNSSSNNTTTNNTGTTTPDSKTSTSTKPDLLMDFDSWDTTHASQTSSPVVKTPTKPMEIKSRFNGPIDALSTNGSNMGIDEDIISVEASSLDSESSWDSFVSAPTNYDGTGSNIDLTEADKDRFMNVHIEDLKIGDVAQLLQAYRQLYVENERLRSELNKINAKK